MNYDAWKTTEPDVYRDPIPFRKPRELTTAEARQLASEIRSMWSSYFDEQIAKWSR